MFFFVRKEVLNVQRYYGEIFKLLQQLDESQLQLLIAYIKARFGIE